MTDTNEWDRSSARRAPRWHRGGCRCESGRFHQRRRTPAGRDVLDHTDRAPQHSRSTERPARAGHLRTSSKSRTTVFQTENEGASPSVRSAQPQHPTHLVRRPLQGICAHSRADSPAEDRRLQHGARGFNSLSALQCVRPAEGTLFHTMDHDGLVTLDSLIRSPHCVRFAGDPLPAALAV